jgi:hypothetical protein
VFDNYGFKKKSVPVIFEPPCIYGTVKPAYFLNGENSAKIENVRPFVKHFMLTYSVCTFSNADKTKP